MVRELAGKGRGHGGGKVILLGEHAVVYGQPAIASGLPLGVSVSLVPAPSGTRVFEPDLPAEVEQAATRAAELAGLGREAGFRLELHGDLPVAVGLGSSAALAVALVRAFADASGETLSAQETTARANRIEEQFHGKPSGIDATTATVGGVLRFRRGTSLEFEPVAVAGDFHFALVDTGTSHTTSATVSSLASRVAEEPDRFEPIFATIGNLACRGERALTSGNPGELGSAMNENHALLLELGVSTPELEAAVHVARKVGAIGAKLTGAGGGGVVLALISPGDDDFIARLAEAGFSSRPFRLAPSVDA